MTIYRNISGAQKIVQAWRNIAGSWKLCVVYRNIGGTWKIVSAGDVTASIEPQEVVGSNFVNPVTATASCQASNGSGQYTYSWVRIGGSSAVGISGPSNQPSVTFSANVTLGGSATALYRCTVTDVITGKTATPTCNVTLYRE